VRIVLGNDHRLQLFIDALAETLSQNGMTVAARSASAHEILAAVAKYEPDVCLLAITLNGTDGLELLRLIRMRHPAIKVVMISEDSDPAVVSAAIDNGVYGYITKDKHIADVIQTLDRVRVGERAFDTGLSGQGPRGASARVSLEPEYLRGLLTFREREVLQMIMEGESAKQMARTLAISLSTVRTHVQSVLVKLGVHSRLEAASIAARSGLLGASSSHAISLQAQLAAGS
jgi:two-component system nitrate/nitrite response regulator NarL